MTAYYTGEKEGVYIDASGLLGYNGTKFKIDDINVNELLNSLVDKVFETIKGAIDGLKGGATAQNIQQAFVDNGEIVIQHGAYSAAEGDGSVDVLSLVSMILDHINVNMDGNIFNIRDISVDLSRDILDTIFSLVFTGDNAGADIPITGALLKYVNNGAQQNKNLTLSAELGVREYNEANTEYSLAPLIGLALGVDITFGKINNLPDFEATFEKLESELDQNEGAYLPILKNGALNTDLLHVNVSTGLTLDIETLKGELAKIEVNMPEKEIGTMFKGILLKALIELGNIDGGLKLDINADVDLTGGLDTSAILDLLLKSSAKIAITRSSDVEGKNPLLAIYLQDGWVYLKADLLCISVKQIKLNVRELIDMLGKSSNDSSSNQALVADEKKTAKTEWTSMPFSDSWQVSSTDSNSAITPSKSSLFPTSLNKSSDFSTSTALRLNLQAPNSTAESALLSTTDSIFPNFNSACSCLWATMSTSTCPSTVCPQV